MKPKEKASSPKNITANDLLFISDGSLRKKIIEAIETISGLYLVEKDSKYPKELTKEVRRIIILYSASIIEAVLLFLYKKKKYRIENIIYKDIYQLPSKFQLESKSKVIIAKQEKIVKSERELMLDVLLRYFTDNKVISESLEEKIKKAKDIRNTFHLSKSRTGLLTGPKIVQVSTDAIYETILIIKEQLDKES